MTNKTIKKNSGRWWERAFCKKWEEGNSPMWRHPADAMRELIIEIEDKALAKQKKKIGQDLLKIADDGEIEELRRVIVNYFHIKK